MKKLKEMKGDRRKKMSETTLETGGEQDEIHSKLVGNKIKYTRNECRRFKFCRIKEMIGKYGNEVAKQKDFFAKGDIFPSHLECSF